MLKGELESNKGLAEGNYNIIVDVKTRYHILRAYLFRKKLNILTMESIVEIFPFLENGTVETVFVQKLVMCMFFGPLSNHRTKSALLNKVLV